MLQEKWGQDWLRGKKDLDDDEENEENDGEDERGDYCRMGPLRRKIKMSTKYRELGRLRDIPEGSRYTEC